MNFLFVSSEGKCLGLVERISKEGHRATLYIVDPKKQEVGKGIVPKEKDPCIIKHNTPIVASGVDKLLSELSPDVVVIDGQGLGEVADYIRERGVKVIGGSKWADIVTTNKEYSSSLIRTVGLTSKEKEGLEVWVEGWWNGLGFTAPSVFYKGRRFMSGDIGKSVECQGVMLRGLNKQSRLHEEILFPFVRLLKKVGYKGAISLRLAVDEKEVSVLEVIVGFNYDVLQAFCCLVRAPLSEFLCGTLNGTHGEGLSQDFSGAIRLSTPINQEGTEIKGINTNNSKYIWMGEVKRTTDGKVYGVGEKVGVVTAHGRDVKECGNRIYRTIEKLDIDNVQYRNDIVERARYTFGKMKRWGYV